MVEEKGTSKASSMLSDLPTDQLKHEVQELAKALGQRAMKQVTNQLGSVGEKLTGGVKDMVSKALPGSAGELASKALPGAAGDIAGKVLPGGDGGNGADGGSGGGGSKVTNIIEEMDIGAPLSVTYNQWTEFSQWPDFMKKLEKVEQESETELSWRGQILWSHRDWKSTITDLVPEDRIVWRSEGAKGYVDGAVTFHELAPNLTKVMVVLEYYPQGFFEKTGNLWRAQGRRVRLELKHFKRHVMTETLLHPDEVEGWHEEIHDGEIQQQDGEAQQQEGEGQQQEGEAQQQEGEAQQQEGEAQQQDGEGQEQEEQPEQEREKAHATQGGE